GAAVARAGEGDVGEAEFVDSDGALIGLAIADAAGRRPADHFNLRIPARAREVGEIRIDHIPAELSLLYGFGAHAAAGDQNVVAGENPQRTAFGAVASEHAAVELAACGRGRVDLPILLGRGRPDAVGANAEIVVRLVERDVLPLVLQYVGGVEPRAAE